MVRDLQQRVADQHERELARGISNVRLEEIEQLGAALVSRRCGRRRDGKRPANVELVPKTVLAGGLDGTSDPTPTTTDGTLRLPESDWIIARSSGRVVHERTNAF